VQGSRLCVRDEGSCSNSFNIHKLCILPTMHLCVLRGSENNERLFMYRLNLPVFITEAESVYCAVRTGSLNQTDTVSSLKGKVQF
jgi:hypothetical protein